MRIGDIKNRTELGPTMQFNTREATVARIASEDMFVNDNEGIRRLVKAGSPIPQYLGMDVEGEVVPTRSISEVAVDQDSSRSLAEAQGLDAPDPRDGLVNTAADLTAAGHKRGRRQQSAPTPEA